MRVTLGLCSLHIRITQVVLKNADAQPFAQTNCIRISSSLSWQLYFFIFKILFYVGVYLINNFVTVSGGQQGTQPYIIWPPSPPNSPPTQAATSH